MVYQALYRKWRPRTFDSVVGQADITNTLKNAIKRGTISHAFLFAGPRGTGKTSCAKIFAKALNCTNLQDGEPCNECANCIAADKGAMADIMEIDAASNNGVDEIREIRDKVKYAPTQGKYKVYIIDEVHMLSMGAFNALLKTLEEPPEHVVFILATTELQKVPATIISRTQRYNFKRITNHDLKQRMKYILEQENIKYEDRALKVIAQVADGGMRDALSILDQLLSYEQDTVKYATALKITGFAARETIEQILLAILNKDAVKAIELAHKQLQQGASSKNILDELIDLATNCLLVLKTGTDDHSNFCSETFIEQIKEFTVDSYFDLIVFANNALTNLRYTNQQQIPLEVFIVESTSQTSLGEANSTNSEKKLSEEIHALKEQMVVLKQKVSSLSETTTSINSSRVYHINSENNSVTKKSKPVKEIKSAKRAKKSGHTSQQNRQRVYHVLENATKHDLQTIKDVWADLQSVLGVSQRAVLEVLEPVAASPDQVVMKCKYTLWFEKTSSDEDLLQIITNQIAKSTQHNYEIVLVPDKDWFTVRSEFLQSHRQELANKKKQTDSPKNSSKELSELKDKTDIEVVAKAKDLFGEAVNIKD
ncbi:DNA polymerase III subunit gamma/tau [Lactobacillus bombicola]|uniref:DNA-directed DNA polymerase n=1 Tax=Lactobacillus bombicola TaxID=1505723 RepID=A0A396SP87_9LACO|nr:DNA polymerase III subunit gamma/tau [Lactobacillus bombicola]RHW52521.1 DNA polymerase III subunit gamma/tau [Lactobacillus bombicola]RHW53975.1 DNA polymerase III subunit gamma/tau [Lactobacillus bombicola]